MPLEEHLQQIDNLRLYRDIVRGRLTALDTFSMPHDMPKPFSDLSEEMVNDALIKKERMLKKVRELQEVNPMLGHRGVRLGIAYPEIYAMQIRAILEATVECAKRGISVRPEIMVPQVITSQELAHVRRTVDELTQQLEKDFGKELRFKFGTMIETVRACTRAMHLAADVEFFSFGTNDLTQAAFSFSREDAENKFLPMYNEYGILQDNPFEVLDIQGVGQLIKMAVDSGRAQRSDLKIGICGEQGGHPASIRFCHYAELDYVSCSGPRVPIARLAAANAKLTAEEFAASQRFQANKSPERRSAD